MRIFNLDFGPVGGIPRVLDPAFTTNPLLGGLPPSLWLGANDGHFGNDCPLGSWCDGNTVWHQVDTAVTDFFGATNIVTLEGTPLTIAPPPTPVSCGFAGGCVLAIDALGLEANILNGLSTIKVGDQECELVYSMAVGCATDSSKVCCRVPPQQTLASLAQFTISGDEEIGGANPNSNYDNTPSSGPPAGFASECAFRGTTSAYTAVLKEFKFFR